MYSCLLVYPLASLPAVAAPFPARHTKSNRSASGPHGKVLSWFTAFLPHIWVHINSSLVTQEENMQSCMGHGRDL